MLAIDVKRLRFNRLQLATVLVMTLFSLTGHAGFKTNKVTAFSSEQGYVSSDREFFRSDQVDTLGSQLGLDAQYDWQKRNYRLVLDGSAFYSFDEQSFYANPRRMFAAADVNLADSRLYLGRQIFTWSEHENIWNRGLWQPRFLWERLNPERQGLVGMFVDSKVSSNVSTLFFWSPIFIPELGPNAEVEAGQFVSANPWFRPPQEELFIFERSTPIEYSLKDPEIDDIVFNPSFGAKIEIKGKAAVLAASYAYKPINQLYLVAPVFMRIGDKSQPSVVDVEVTPKVNYHHLSTLGAQWLPRNDLRLHTSLTHENIDFKQTYSEDWFQQRSRKATIFDTSIHKTWAGQTQTFLAYTKVWGGDLPVNHEFVQDRYMFPRRYEYFEGIKAGVKNDFHSLFKKPASWGTDVTYDWAQRGAVFSARGSIRLMSQFTVLVSADFLGLVDNEEPDEEHGLIQDFRANDRLWAEVKYVF